MGNYCCESYNKRTLLARRSSMKCQSASQQSFFMPICSKNDILGKLEDAPPYSYKFQAKGEIGRGAQGSVNLGTIIPLDNTEQSQEPLETAVKKIYKQKLSLPNQIQSIRLEHRIMSEFNNPFLMKTIFTNETPEAVQFYMHVAHGGNLSSFTESTLGKGSSFRKLGSEAVRFVLCGVILALEQLHNNGIVYRDLKLENILIDSEGYPILSDFGHSILQSGVKAEQIKGTIPYVAPQMIEGNVKYNRGVDIWSLGVLIYFLINQQFPYFEQEIVSGEFTALSRQKEEKYKLRSSKTINFADDQKQLLENLINKMLVVNFQKRIGYQSLEQTKAHPYFKGVDWQKYNKKVYKSSLKPIVQKHKLSYEPLQELTFSILSGYSVQLERKRQVIRRSTLETSGSSLKEWQASL